MGFGEWPQFRDLAVAFQSKLLVSGQIYQNTTPYPQIVVVNCDLNLGAAASTTLVGTATVTASAGATSPPGTYVGGAALGSGLRGFSPAGTQGLNVNSSFTILVPPGWYWSVTGTLTGHGTLIVLGARIWAPVAPGY